MISSETKILLLDFEYFGLQNGDECHCGNSASRFQPTYPSECNKRCSGNEIQFCGNNWRLNVFQNFELTASTTTSTTTPTTTPTTTTVEPKVSLVHITGSIQTNQDYTENFASTKNREYINFKNITEFEIKSILETNSFVVNAVEPRQKRSTGKALAEFISTCSYQVPKIEDMNEIESNITNTIRSVNSSQFESFDHDSFLESSFNLSFAEPKIIEFNPPSVEEVMAKISLMENMTQPDPEELESLYTEVVEDNSKCQGSNQWTGWNSARDPTVNFGDDYETLHDHQFLFG